MAPHKSSFQPYLKTRGNNVAVNVVEIPSVDVMVEVGSLSPTNISPMGETAVGGNSANIQPIITESEVKPALASIPEVQIKSDNAELQQLEVKSAPTERSPTSIIATEHVLDKDIVMVRKDTPVPEIMLKESPVDQIETIAVPIDVINVNLSQQSELPPITNIHDFEADTKTIISSEGNASMRSVDMIHDESSDSIDLDPTPENIHHSIDPDRTPVLLVEGGGSDCSIQHDEDPSEIIMSTDSIDLNQEPEFTSTPTPSIQFQLSHSQSKASLASSSRLNRKSVISFVLVESPEIYDTTSESTRKARLVQQEEEEEERDQVLELISMHSVRTDRPRISLNLSRPSEFKEKAIRAQSLDMKVVKTSNRFCDF